jgi:hypothetical protein
VKAIAGTQAATGVVSTSQTHLGAELPFRARTQEFGACSRYVVRMRVTTLIYAVVAVAVELVWLGVIAYGVIWVLRQ